MSDHIPVEEIGQIFDKLAEKLPKLIRALRDSVFSGQAGTEIGEGVGNFYTTLIEKGIPEDKAFKLTSSYMRTLENLGNKLDLKDKLG